MTRFLLSRVAQSAISILGASVIIFVISRLSGDPVLQMTPIDATPEMIANLRARLGLDLPLWRQYLVFLGDALQGDFGQSYRWEMPAAQLILDRAPATLLLAAAALGVSLAIAVPVGVLSAVHRGGWIDRVGRAIAVLGQAMPHFWIGLLLILLFSIRLGWLPAVGYGSPSNLILPAIALGWYPAAAQMRVVRSAMLDVLDSEYIRVGRAMGVPPRLLIWKYALRNAAAPLATLMGVYFAGMIGGAFVVEVIFAWPGVGRTVVEAVFSRDFPVVQAGVLLSAVIFVLSNLAVDLSYGLIDPRIRDGR
ncbi:ABC transporter permease [uncultured Albimonas sp.]|uniref:ABC transporter permease n=1 Tax=uncultured Albimonas sp. TaxID=1331701 RepID=UPI0030EE5655|tara:strand:+ start:10466 stop:11386 length:921 start_codon:yes stop_codon:yes gene_type:complete